VYSAETDRNQGSCSVTANQACAGAIRLRDGSFNAIWRSCHGFACACTCDCPLPPRAIPEADAAKSAAQPGPDALRTMTNGKPAWDGPSSWELFAHQHLQPDASLSRSPSTAYNAGYALAVGNLRRSHPLADGRSTMRVFTLELCVGFTGDIKSTGSCSHAQTHSHRKG
jgi:hypothetical protein